MEWWLKCMKNYFKFSGRARCKEYWMFIVWQIIFIFCFGFIAAATEKIGMDAAIHEKAKSVIQTVLVVFFWATIIPTLAVSVRRLHDTGKSGWALFIGLVPIIGGIIQIIWLAESGSKDDNKYGAPPISGQPCFEPILQEDDS